MDHETRRGLATRGRGGHMVRLAELLGLCLCFSISGSREEVRGSDKIMHVLGFWHIGTGMGHTSNSWNGSICPKGKVEKS